MAFDLDTGIIIILLYITGATLTRILGSWCDLVGRSAVCINAKHIPLNKSIITFLFSFYFSSV
jgi:hypothetical protein